MSDETLRETVEFYTLTDEEGRLGKGSAQLEFERTKELMSRVLPQPPAAIVDVGGGSGPYAFWLAGLGYEVHLVDATPRLVELVRQADQRAASRLASTAIGDARHLPLPDGLADAVLLMGPLYHLQERADRLLALTEARRVTRPNGVAVVAGISRYAGTLDGMVFHPLIDEALARMRHRVVADGQYRNTSGNPRYFTTAFFHRPEDLAEELTAAGFDAVHVFGVEGPAWLLRDFDARWAEPAGREEILRVARLLEQEPSVVGASAHLLAIGRKTPRALAASSDCAFVGDARVRGWRSAGGPYCAPCDSRCCSWSPWRPFPSRYCADSRSDRVQQSHIAHK